ncbi:hypothetical protein H0X06_01555 [Candidatus Dependentiae bacterium]|nr:hypothetical protein [Candidatus Dependentiae bacterium]
MKKLLSAVLIMAASTGFISAHSDNTMKTGNTQENMAALENMMKEMISFKKKIDGKTFTMPGDLIKDWSELKAEKLRVGAEELRDCGKENFKAGSPQMKKYEQAARSMETLASTIEALPVNKTMKKTFKNVSEWMDLKSRKGELKAETMKEIARQLNDKDMEKKADMFASLIEKHKDMMSEEGEDSYDNESDEQSQEGEDSDQEAPQESKRSYCPAKRSSEEKLETSTSEETDTK